MKIVRRLFLCVKKKAVLRRQSACPKKRKKHINIDVEFGEGEGQLSLKKLQEELNEQKPKKNTTYKDIQAYIEEKYKECLEKSK